MNKIIYRPDIDGLRAIAVLAVVIFHSKREILSGGFVGVDVFFVISGYLITSIIISEIKVQRFSLLKFYDRRIRRIFPAFLFFLFISSIASYWILFPNELYSYSKSQMSSLFLVSNFYFWRNSGYFSSTVDTNPLLHTWSLSIEEQFYLLFPISLLILVRFFKKHKFNKIFLTLGVVFFISFFLSAWGVENKPSASFYLLPTRSWELLLGSLLTFTPFLRLNIRLRSILAGSGILMLFFSFYYFSKDIGFPGINALLPCMGASLIIFSDHKQTDKNYIARIISVKPFVFIGLISYSLYLWHWGIIVYYKHYMLEAPSLYVVLIFSFIFSIISWKFVEQPFRKISSNLFVYSSLSTLFIMLVAFSIYGYTSKGVPKRLPEKLAYMKINGLDKLSNPYRKRCFSWGGKGIPLNQVGDKSCRMGDKQQKIVSFVLMGDSHADALFTSVDIMAKKAQKKGMFFGYGGCNPVQGMLRKRVNHNCEAFKEVYYQKIYEDINIKKVIFSARWASSLYGKTYDLGPAEPEKVLDKDLLRLVEEPNRVLSKKEREKYFFMRMKKTVTSLVKMGKQVVVISSIPEVGYNVPYYIARKQLSLFKTELINNKEYFYSRHQQLLTFFSELSKINGVSIVYPHKKLCAKKEKYCIYQINNKPLYYDDDHLSIQGAEFVAPMLEHVF